jgi:hypothetical protein
LRFSLGGVLSIVNGLGWVCLLAGLRYLPEVAVTLLMPLMILLALPIGVFALMPTTGIPSPAEMVSAAVVLGVNSLIWGHGVAWVVRWVGRQGGWVSCRYEEVSVSGKAGHSHGEGHSERPAG